MGVGTGGGESPQESLERPDKFRDRSRQTQVRAGGCSGREELGKVGGDFAGHTRGSDFVLRAVEMPSGPVNVCVRPSIQGRAWEGSSAGTEGGGGALWAGLQGASPHVEGGLAWAPCEAGGGGLPGLGKAVLAGPPSHPGPGPPAPRLWAHGPLCFTHILIDVPVLLSFWSNSQMLGHLIRKYFMTSS